MVRPQDAALVLGSGEIIADFVSAGWLRPVLSAHRLVLYRHAHLEECVARLEAGEPLLPDQNLKRPKPPGHPVPTCAPVTETLSFANQLRGIVSLRPLLARPEQAAALIGSVELLDEFRLQGWLRPLIAKHHLTLYSVRHLEACVSKLESGQKLGQYAESGPAASSPAPKRKPQPVAVVPQKRLARKTRRPMPPETEAVAA